MTRFFQYRLPNPTMAQATIGGYSFGNIFITTMAAITGSFESGIAESSRDAGGARADPAQHAGECDLVRRGQAGAARRQHGVAHRRGESVPPPQARSSAPTLQPAHARYPEAVRALLQADLIVAGPGSFFTSVLPNLLVDSIRDAICASSAVRIYVCNGDPGR